MKATALQGVPIDFADGKLQRYFPIFSGWIANHMENVLLHRIKSNSCPQCVLTEHLGIPSVHHDARDHTRYDYYQRENETHHTKIEHCWDTVETLCIKIGQNGFHYLPQVSPSDLHKTDMLHTVYFGLFKPIIDWIQRYLKKHARQQAFDDAWKALPPFPGFYVPKQAYREVT